MKKVKVKNKKRPKTYETKLAIEGTLDDVLKVAAIQADKKINTQSK